MHTKSFKRRRGGARLVPINALLGCKNSCNNPNQKTLQCAVVQQESRVEILAEYKYSAFNQESHFISYFLIHSYQGLIAKSSPKCLDKSLYLKSTFLSILDPC